MIAVFSDLGQGDQANSGGFLLRGTSPSGLLLIVLRAHKPTDAVPQYTAEGELEGARAEHFRSASLTIGIKRTAQVCEVVQY